MFAIVLQFWIPPSSEFNSQLFQLKTTLLIWFPILTGKPGLTFHSRTVKLESAVYTTCRRCRGLKTWSWHSMHEEIDVARLQRAACSVSFWWAADNLLTAMLVSPRSVCRKWRALTSDDELWRKLFSDRWGADAAAFYAPAGTKSWKDVFVVQDRCDRYGL